ncbi:D-alanyl-D-alanine dipeptidase/carboxypeptidase [Paenibacillus endophyticus]|uniref:D-alanyl-D-alanine dipeptidase/carboxypeptidase n=1 Tax=Paenibacillus endophyticus TaxID=1294268 RepID=A0A7W5C5H9_9BACL|nr:D-alanyl-D-alanine carboxypeptidase family protein [Paenibacillus endophyticus]MBB3151562.1 D-alanyl-D-alanine dipeptidase/carboxypeptidase [Paenibacillus endophyticus]
MGQRNPFIQIEQRPYVKHSAVQASRREIHEGSLVLVNRTNPIQQPLSTDKLQALSIYPNLNELHDGMLLEKNCLQQLVALLEACKGLEDIVAVSGYRSKDEQEQIYASSFIENGPEYTACYVAKPDQSEHQTGLAIDVGKRDNFVDFIAPSFPDSGVYQHFKQLAAQFGFIQRYKKGKESITNISCEPWHFRYVGFPHAEIMEKNDFCLEEYIEWIRSYSYAGERFRYENESLQVAIYYVPAEDAPSTTVPITSCDLYRISGNNSDGFIISAFTGKGHQVREQ